VVVMFANIFRTDRRLALWNDNQRYFRSKLLFLYYSDVDATSAHPSYAISLRSTCRWRATACGVASAMPVELGRSRSGEADVAMAAVVVAMMALAGGCEALADGASDPLGLGLLYPPRPRPPQPRPLRCGGTSGVLDDFRSALPPTATGVRAGGPGSSLSLNSELLVEDDVESRRRRLVPSDSITDPGRLTGLRPGNVLSAGRAPLRMSATAENKVLVIAVRTGRRTPPGQRYKVLEGPDVRASLADRCAGGRRCRCRRRTIHRDDNALAIVSTSHGLGWS